MDNSLKKNVPLFFILILMMSIPVLVHANLGLTQCDARTGGINGGLSAMADDIFSMQYNPAGLSRLPFPGIATGMGSDQSGLSDGTNIQKTFLGYAHPFQFLIPWRRDSRFGSDQAVGIGLYQFSSGSFYTEKIVYLSYARQIYPRFSAGFTVKQLKRSFGNSPYIEDAVDNDGERSGERDTFFDSGKSKTAVTGDLGLLYRFGDFTRYSLSFVLRNITQPDMALGTAKDAIPLITSLGFAYRFPKLNVSLDWLRGKLLGAHNESRFVLVGEKWFPFEKIGRIAARGILGFGSRNYRTFGLGSSYLFKRFRLDYGFSIPLSGIEQTLGSHYVNLIFSFGDQDPEEYFSPELRKKRSLRRLAEKELERARHERAKAEKAKNKAMQEIEALQKFALELAGKKSEKKAKEYEKKAYDIFKRVYEIILEVYDKKIKDGFSLKNRKIFLQRTVREFSKLNIDISLARKELKKVKKKFDNVTEKYSLTMFYYKKVVDRGASDNEKISILKRIIKKYYKYGIDMSDAEDELRKIQ